MSARIIDAKVFGMKDVFSTIGDRVRKFETANRDGFIKGGNAAAAYLRLIMPRSKGSTGGRPHLADDLGSKVGKFKDSTGFWMIVGAHFKRQPHDHLVEDGSRPRYGANDSSKYRNNKNALTREKFGMSKRPTLAVTEHFNSFGGGRSRIGGKFAFVNRYDAQGNNITSLSKLQTGRMPALHPLARTMGAMNQRVSEIVHETVKSRLSL